MHAISITQSCSDNDECGVNRTYLLSTDSIKRGNRGGGKKCVEKIVERVFHELIVLYMLVLLLRNLRLVLLLQKSFTKNSCSVIRCKDWRQQAIECGLLPYTIATERYPIVRTTFAGRRRFLLRFIDYVNGWF